MDYKSKYLKYKSKYLHIKKLLGGSAEALHRQNVITLNNLKESIRKFKDKLRTHNAINIRDITYYDKVEFDEHIGDVVEELHTLQITPKIVFIIGHGANVQQHHVNLKDMQIQEGGGEEQQVEHKIVTLFSKGIDFQTNTNFIILFIQNIIDQFDEYITEHLTKKTETFLRDGLYDFNQYINNNPAEIDDIFIIRAINNFREKINEIIHYDSSGWSHRDDAFSFLMSHNQPNIQKYKDFNEGLIRIMKFSEQHDGLFILGIDRWGEPYYNFSQIQQNNMNTNLNNIILNDIIDKFKSPIYFIPISCQSIQESSEFKEEEVDRTTRRDQGYTSFDHPPLEYMCLPDQTKPDAPVRKPPPIPAFWPGPHPDPDNNRVSDFSLFQKKSPPNTPL